MALTVTSLAGACTQGASQIKLTAFTSPTTVGISQNTMALVDGEWMRITDATLSPTVTVTRGDSNPPMSSNAVAHNALAPVVYGLTTDFTQGFNVAQAPVISYSVNGAITVPTVDQTIYLTKAGVAAMTLAAPANDQTNTVTVISLTANAHTITYTAGFYQNTTSSDVATFPSTSGASFVFKAKNGVWNAVGNVSSAGVTLG